MPNPFQLRTTHSQLGAPVVSSVGGGRRDRRRRRGGAVDVVAVVCVAKANSYLKTYLRRNTTPVLHRHRRIVEKAMRAGASIVGMR